METPKIVFILDRSGSMQSIWNDVVGGFKTFIKDQKKLGNPKFSLTTFDTEVDKVYDQVDLKDVKSTLDTDRIYPRGMTALLDAVGKTIAEIKGKKVMVVVFTDGLENSSHEYKKDQIKKIIDDKQKKGWGFLFLGADQDAFAEASQYGFNSGQTMSYRSATPGAAGATIGVASTSTSDYLYSGQAVSVPDTLDESTIKTPTP